ncbi:MAG: hypothetical protein RI922_176 [Bacteroidota bacterium]|jgi:hypothetical protein
MDYFKSFSKICLFVIGSVFAIILLKESFVQKEQRSCVAAYDQFGYYSYLPATFIYDDLAFQKPWKEKLQSYYCEQEIVYQFVDLEGGKKVNMYHMGLSYLHLPGFVIANSLAKPLGYKQDGMSEPYRVALKLTALFFILFGLIFFRKTLLLFFPDWIAGLVLLLVYGASNLFVTFYYGDLMPHLYLFTLNTIFIYSIVSYLKKEQWRYLLSAILILGLTVAIRPTQAIWGIVPFILFLYQYKLSWKALKLLALFPLGALLMNFPQLLYWKIEGGSWIIMNLHSETLSFLKPYTLDFLFSFKKGWLLYSPLFIFSFVGIWLGLRQNKQLVTAISVFALINIYVLSSWDCWWYAASFGSRVMVDSYIVFGVLLGFFIQGASKSMKVLIPTLSIFFLIMGLSVFQSFQYFEGIIHNERMTKDYYWSVFGRTSADQLDRSLLEIDRNDLNWDQNIFADHSMAKQKGYKLIEKSLYRSQKRIEFGVDQEFISLSENEFKLLLPTDEAKIRIRFNSSIDTSGKQQFLCAKIEGKKTYFEYYSVFDGEKTIGVFNLPVIRQTSDALKVFIYNPNKVPGFIEDIEISAIYLQRK